jgi:hypothetical protein
VESKRLQRLYDRVRDNRKNCSFEDIRRLLLAVGFTQRNASGSHSTFKCGPLTITVPRRRPVREVYVDEALTLVDQVLREH